MRSHNLGALGAKLRSTADAKVIWRWLNNVLGFSWSTVYSIKNEKKKTEICIEC